MLGLDVDVLGGCFVRTCMCLKKLNAMQAPCNYKSSRSYRRAPRTECERLEGLKPLGDVHAFFFESVRVQVQQQGVGAEARAPLHVLPMD